MKSCNANFHIESNQCAANVRACTIANGKGEQTWDGTKYGPCTLKSCNTGYQVTAGACTPTFVGKFLAKCFTTEGVDVLSTNHFIDDVKHDLIVKVFSSNNGTCTTPYRDIRRPGGTYQRIGLSTTAPGAVKIDFIQPELEITLRSALAVTEHNTQGVCGKKNWVINTAYTFTRAQCNAGSGTTKTINKIDGDTLYVGDFTNPADLDADGRPTKLNTQRISTRI